MARKTADKEKPVEVAKEDAPRMKVSGDLPRLETNIDELYDKVRKAKNLTFLEAAEHFDVEKAQIAMWAKILEDHKLVRVHYPIFGSPVIFSMDSAISKNGKISKEGEGEGARPGSGLPKIIIPVAGGLMIFFGYVMFVSNPFTITLRSSIVSTLARLTGGLRYPFNFIVPAGIIIAAVLAVVFLRSRKPKPKGEKKEKPEEEKPKRKGKEEPKKEPPKKGKDNVDDKLEKIKKELGSR